VRITVPFAGAMASRAALTIENAAAAIGALMNKHFQHPIEFYGLENIRLMMLCVLAASI